MDLTSDTPSEYYKHSISIPLLDHTLSVLNCRFSSHNQVASKGMCLVPAVMVTMTKEETQKRVNNLVEMYKTDFPSTNGIDGEIFMLVSQMGEAWKGTWKRKFCHTLLIQALRNATTLFPNMILIQILCTLPVTTCSLEHSHSGLKRIKVPYCSMMTNQRLTALSLLNIHRDIDCDVESINDEFSRRHPRPLKLCNILAD